jgi:hypothetical protein
LGDIRLVDNWEVSIILKIKWSVITLVEVLQRTVKSEYSRILEWIRNKSVEMVYLDFKLRREKLRLKKRNDYH